MPDAMEKACEKAGIKPEDLDYIIPHQANIRIIDTAVKRMNVDIDKVFVNIQETGNISSACIPVCLTQLVEQGKVKPGDKVGMVGFGAGLIYGAIVLTV